MNRVVVTGVGLVTGLGTDAASTWAGLLAGRSAVGPLRGFDASSLRTRIGVEVEGLDAREHVRDRRSLRNMTRNDQLAVVGADLAASDAALKVPPHAADRAGLFLAGRKEISDPAKVLDAVLAVRDEDGAVDIGRMGTVGAGLFYPLFYVEGLQAASLFYISKEQGLRGANTYFSGASDAGSTAIGRGYRAIRHGEADVVVAGAFDDATSWWNASSLDDFGILSRANELGAGACRPYSRDADGSVLGEGAAFVVLESAESARARRASVYAEVTGFGSRFDTRHESRVAPDGSALAGAMTAALDEAGVAANDVGLVVTEGTAIPVEDRSEAAALRTVMRDRRAPVPATTVKPAVGNLLTGSGALNVVVGALALRHRAVPPVLNLHDPDPACGGVDWATSARELAPRHVLALGRGTEGQNNSVLLSACAEQDR